MKRTNYIEFCDKVHTPIGASETIPNLTLPVHELMERLTDHTLDDLRAKSLLHGESFPVDPNVDIMAYADKLCLGERCIDITDVHAVRAELQLQIEEMQKRMSQKIEKPVQSVDPVAAAPQVPKPVVE